MGWTTYHRSKGQTHPEHFESEMNPSMKILESSTKGNTFYAAVQKEDGEVFALVILFQWAPRSYYNFGTKWMDETVGPYQSEAPAKILDLLTPTGSKYAIEWRERCRKNLETKTAAAKQRAKVKPGDVIRIDHALNFTGGESATDFKLRVGGRAPRWTANPGTDNAFGVRLPRDWASRYKWELV